MLAQPVDTTVVNLNERSPLYVALITRSYQHDLAALKAILPRSPRYIGMIGSQKRVKTVLQTLRQEGISGMDAALVASQLDAIHAPIGLDLGALTPAEIAVSICAELITVYRGGSGRSLSGRSHMTRSHPTPSQTLPESVGINGAIVQRAEQQAQQQ